MWTEMSNKEILTTLGRRLKEYRMRRDLQQKTLAEKSGVSVDTVNRVEHGESVAMEKLIRILRTLDMLDNFDLFIPEPPVSPLLIRKLQGKPRYRIRSKKLDD
jgi:transcriptional regulator with XRE-family HTH domain